MNKRLTSSIIIVAMLFTLLPLTFNIDVRASPGNGKIVFKWVNETTKSFWINNTYISCYFEGTQGASLIDLRNHKIPGVDFVDDVKITATGPDIGWVSSRWGVDVSNVSVAFKMVSDDLAVLNVTTLNNNIKFEITYFFTDGEIILVRYSATLLSPMNLTSIGAEFVPATLATSGAKVFYVDYYGTLKSITLNGSMAAVTLGNSSEGTLPLAEDWVAIYNPTQNLAAGVIWFNPESFIGEKSTVGAWDGAIWSVVSLYAKWFEYPAGKVFPAGTTFVNYAIIWAGPGDYHEVRKIAGLLRNIQYYYDQNVVVALQKKYTEYVSTHSYTNEEYQSLLNQYQALEQEYSDYKSKYTVTQAQLQQVQTSSTVIGLVVGLIVGLVVGWFIAKRRR